MSVDLNKLEEMCDKVLEIETTETLNKWINQIDDNTVIPQYAVNLTSEEIEFLKELLGEKISRLNQTYQFYSNTELWLEKFRKVHTLFTKIQDIKNENSNSTE